MGEIKRSFNEILVMCDKQAWVWNFASQVLQNLNKEHVRLPSTTPIRQSWLRFKNSERIIVHWECSFRGGGALIEEILEIDPLFNVGERVIVLTANPMHSDVVYFNELGLQKIVKLSNNARDLEKSTAELQQFILSADNPHRRSGWQKVLRVINHMSPKTPPEQWERVHATIEQLHKAQGGKPSAVFNDALAALEHFRGNDQQAETLWLSALDINPNYHRTYNNLIQFYKNSKQYEKALDLLKKMQTLNKNSISRMVRFGEIHADMNDDVKAEHYFKQALEKDKLCSSALNGLAEVRFRQNQLDEARNLLAKSMIAYKTAQYLNQKGIVMVKANQFKEALEHYSKAQFVLPQQEKGPMLFFNIGLCYSRWGRPDMAAEFLKIALIKEPNYLKARRLLDQVMRMLPQKSAG